MDEKQNEKSPFFKNWKYWYLLVAGFLLLLIILFYFFTKYFS
jgi:hypothetical protein